MKHIYTFAASLLIAVSTLATVITVDNNANSAGQYIGLQPAIDAANAGDSIYISGSTTSYGYASLNKRLVLFGTGYNPAKQNPIVSTVGNIAFDTVVSVSGASGSRIYGLQIAGGYLVDNYGAKNVIIERNYFNASYIQLHASTSGIVFRNNVIYNNHVYLIAGTSNIMFENNLMYGGSIRTGNQPSLVINHNVFMNPVANGEALYQISFATVTNNIFWGPTPLGSSVTNNTFNNNLTFQTSNDAIPGASNSGSGNLVSVSPQFVNVPSPGLDFSYNYNVTNASAAHNAATDGTDLGVFGGASAMPNITGMPAIPQMVEMLISNPVVAPAGNLNVTFKAKKNN